MLEAQARRKASEVGLYSALGYRAPNAFKAVHLSRATPLAAALLNGRQYTGGKLLWSHNHTLIPKPRMNNLHSNQN